MQRRQDNPPGLRHDDGSRKQPRGHDEPTHTGTDCAVGCCRMANSMIPGPWTVIDSGRVVETRTGNDNGWLEGVFGCLRQPHGVIVRMGCVGRLMGKGRQEEAREKGKNNLYDLSGPAANLQCVSSIVQPIARSLTSCASCAESRPMESGIDIKTNWWWHIVGCREASVGTRTSPSPSGRWPRRGFGQ